MRGSLSLPSDLPPGRKGHRSARLTTGVTELVATVSRCKSFLSSITHSFLTPEQLVTLRGRPIISADKISISVTAAQESYKNEENLIQGCRLKNDYPMNSEVLAGLLRETLGAGRAILTTCVDVWSKHSA